MVDEIVNIITDNTDTDTEPSPTFRYALFFYLEITLISTKEKMVGISKKRKVWCWVMQSIYM